MNIAAGGLLVRDRAGVGERQLRFRRRAEIAGPADQPRIIRRDRIEHLAGRGAGGEPLRVGRKGRKIAIPSGRRSAGPKGVVSLGERRMAPAKKVESLAPATMGFASTFADALREMLVDPVRNEKLGIFGPAVGALGEPHLLLAERLAVRRAGVLLVR